MDTGPGSPAVQLLRAAAADGATVVLSGHVQPDADALGSVLALATGLRRCGATVVTTFPAPFVLPDSLAWLPGAADLTPPDRVPPAPDLFVSLDAASPGRLGGLAGLLDSARSSLVVDHHASNPGFGEVRLVDPGAAGTVVLVAGLLDGLGVTVDAEIATCLYAGLTADTGSFRFGNTSPATHELAARLLDTGIDHAAISRRLFDTAPFGWLGLVAAAAGRARLEPDVGHGLVWTWSSTTEAAEHGVAADQLEALVDIVRSTAEADVACVLKGQDDGSWSVSLRSRGGTDVSRVAGALGGGGHRLAAGLTSHRDREGTIAAVRAELGALPAAGTAPRPGAVPDLR
ncbi:bifunctional oligoribonuclease/PAP phosphatase NrnA [Modestobacter sp. I12A-02628]|uniref:Bifunctional oligoribonuclease/PAP phosphatase NrnA n=1 Tax=Goekera deserti TaxID=2497753 RepID=A0A7K3WIT0_9ACTN|nr:bifunctional oligoribonuclease/PAP phosphatase NrnA [Goekera deserti]NDI50261.1 bifunctional oligoribonuclease/PAP phosphatase NrnA [Goekera deserti]NEL55829.1 bifunctional oligoribonuclease/PAP phosphatase NrnA [Goekera deserti]